MTIIAKLNGIPMKIAIDSGCTTSIMSTETFKKYKEYLIYRKSDEKIKAANDQISKVKGKVLDVKVEIANHVCKLDLLIFDHTDHDVLLGLDYCQLTNIGIFPGKNMIKLKNERIYMDTDINSVTREPKRKIDHRVTAAYKSATNRAAEKTNQAQEVQIRDLKHSPINVSNYLTLIIVCALFGLTMAENLIENF